MMPYNPFPRFRASRLGEAPFPLAPPYFCSVLLPGGRIVKTATMPDQISAVLAAIETVSGAVHVTPYSSSQTAELVEHVLHLDRELSFLEWRLGCLRTEVDPDEFRYALADVFSVIGEVISATAAHDKIVEHIILDETAVALRSHPIFKLAKDKTIHLAAVASSVADALGCGDLIRCIGNDVVIAPRATLAGWHVKELQAWLADQSCRRQRLRQAFEAAELEQLMPEIRCKPLEEA